MTLKLNLILWLVTLTSVATIEAYACEKIEVVHKNLVNYVSQNPSKYRRPFPQLMPKTSEKTTRLRRIELARSFFDYLNQSGSTSDLVFTAAINDLLDEHCTVDNPPNESSACQGEQPLSVVPNLAGKVDAISSSYKEGKPSEESNHFADKTKKLLIELFKTEETFKASLEQAIQFGNLLSTEKQISISDYAKVFGSLKGIHEGSASFLSKVYAEVRKSRGLKATDPVGNDLLAETVAQNLSKYLRYLDTYLISVEHHYRTYGSVYEKFNKDLLKQTNGESPEKPIAKYIVSEFEGRWRASVDSRLITAVQRMPRYVLLLKEIANILTKNDVVKKTLDQTVQITKNSNSSISR